jgi:hypothetical protein
MVERASRQLEWQLVLVAMDVYKLARDCASAYITRLIATCDIRQVNSGPVSWTPRRTLVVTSCNWRRQGEREWFLQCRVLCNCLSEQLMAVCVCVWGESEREEISDFNLEA